MSNYREQWDNLLSELDRRQALAEGLGGEDKVARQHDRGRLTARERLDLLFDEGSFNEMGALVGGNHPGGDDPLAGDGVVGGTGRVNGRSAVALAEDATVKGGSIGHANSAKRSRLVRVALEQQLPLVVMLDGAGHRAENSTERYPNAPGDLQLLADLAGKVPVVTMVLGYSAGHGALTGMLADFIVMVEGAALFTAGPPLVQAALGIDVSPEELGGSKLHACESGVVHNLAKTEASAFLQVKQFLSMLPDRRDAAPPAISAAPEADRRSVDKLLDIIPTNGDTPYDVQQVIAILADSQTVFELQPGYGQSMIVALARFGGTPCMLVANQPAVMAGAITHQAAEKAAHFIDLASNFGLPLVTLLDNPGVMPGPQSERAGILKASARMFAAQRRFRGVKIVVTLRKAYGFGSSVMGMNPWDNQAISLALPSVSLGGVPAIGGARAAGINEEGAAKMQASQSGAWIPADAMAFDKVIHPAQLRDEIIAVLQRHQTN